MIRASVFLFEDIDWGQHSLGRQGRRSPSDRRLVGFWFSDFPIAAFLPFGHYKFLIHRLGRCKVTGPATFIRFGAIMHNAPRRACCRIVTPQAASTSVVDFNAAMLDVGRLRSYKAGDSAISPEP
jgi:hypothetical protein